MVGHLNITRLKAELLCYGVRSPQEVDKGRVGGSGAAGGRYLLVPGTDTPTIHTPFQGSFIPRSPYWVERLEQGYPYSDYMLYRNDEPLTKIQITEPLKFLEKEVRDGIPIGKISYIHGTDMLAFTISRICTYWSSGEQCGYCSIQMNIKTYAGKSLAVKDPEQVAEAVFEAEKWGIKHLDLTTGTPGTRDKGVAQFLPFLREIRRNSSISIRVELEPPEDVDDLEKLSEADSIGINIESLDDEVRRRVCPGKSKTPLSKYFEAWRKAIEVFEDNQVNSYVLVGMGEDPEQVSKRLDEVASVGVIPHVVAFRPQKGAKMEGCDPPRPELLLNTLSVAAEAVKKYGLNPEAAKAGCTRCGGCSPIREALKYGV